MESGLRRVPYRRNAPERLNLTNGTDARFILQEAQIGALLLPLQDGSNLIEDQDGIERRKIVAKVEAAVLRV
jgi:hypothetical protein